MMLKTTVAQKILYKIVLAGLSAILLCCNGTGASPAAPQLPATAIDYLAKMSAKIPQFFDDYVLIGDDPTIKKKEEQYLLDNRFIHSGTIFDYRSVRIHFSPKALGMIKDWLINTEKFKNVNDWDLPAECHKITARFLYLMNFKKTIPLLKWFSISDQTASPPIPHQ